MLKKKDKTTTIKRQQNKKHRKGRRNVQIIKNRFERVII